MLGKYETIYKNYLKEYKKDKKKYCLKIKI